MTMWTMGKNELREYYPELAKESEERPEPPTEWWLISKGDAAMISSCLRTMIEKDPKGSTALKHAMHTLDSGLRKTDEVPGDYVEEYPTFSKATDAARVLAGKDGHVRRICAYGLHGPYIIRLSELPTVRGSVHATDCFCDSCVRFKMKKKERTERGT